MATGFTEVSDGVPLQHDGTLPDWYVPPEQRWQPVDEHGHFEHVSGSPPAGSTRDDHPPHPRGEPHTYQDASADSRQRAYPDHHATPNIRTTRDELGHPRKIRNPGPEYHYHMHQSPVKSKRKTREEHRSPPPADQQQIQVVAAGPPAQQNAGPNIGEQMQMMMMNQMMMQQMSAQQMQMAQMAALTRDAQKVAAPKVKKKKPKRPSVKIHSNQRRAHQGARPVIMPAVVQPAALPPDVAVESGAMENWQEATIILCIAIVGLIYLVVSRNAKAEKDEVSLAAKHLVPKS